MSFKRFLGCCCW